MPPNRRTQWATSSAEQPTATNVDEQLTALDLIPELLLRKMPQYFAGRFVVHGEAGDGETGDVLRADGPHDVRGGLEAGAAVALEGCEDFDVGGERGIPTPG